MEDSYRESKIKIIGAPMSRNQDTKTIPSATIIMLREENDCLEAFMVVRHHEIDFASGALVFPGGKIDQQDYEMDIYCEGINKDEPFDHAYKVGAIREAFEESGILFARTRGSKEIISSSKLKELSHYRKALHSGQITFRDFLVKENLVLACDELYQFAHWITPKMMPKRFDTQFFIARAPHQTALHDGNESIDSFWLSPKEALEGNRNGKFTIIFPTRVNIEFLAEIESIERAIAESLRVKIKAVLPRVEHRDDGAYVVIDEDTGYKTTSEKIPS